MGLSGNKKESKEAVMDTAETEITDVETNVVDTNTDSEERDNAETSSEPIKEEEMMGNQGPAQYLFLAFEGDNVYINPETDDIVVSHVTSSGKAIDVQGWTGSDKCKAKLCAKDEYKVELDQSIPKEKKGSKHKNPRKDAATEELRKLFKDEIEVARALKKDDDSSEKGQNGEDKSIEDQIESVIPKMPRTEAKSEEKKDNEQPKGSLDVKSMEFTLLTEIRQLSQDIGDSGNDTTEAISREISSASERLCNVVKKCGENATSSTREVGRNIVQAVRAEASNLSTRLQNDAKKNQEELLKGTKSIQKKVDKIDEVCEATEMMEGKLTKLDQLEAIVSILSEKGVEISRDFPPTCEEEEDIINLVRYSKKITEQLGYAARELIRKKAHYDSKDQSLANEQAVTEKKIFDARAEGIAEGKLFVLKALLSKYADVDTIMESEYDHVHVLWALMQELDVVIDGDGEYKKGNVVDITEENAEKMAAIYKKIEGAGKYRVSKTGLKYGDEIIFKAEFEKMLLRKSL